MQSMRKPKRVCIRSRFTLGCSRAFTLVEMIAVLIIIGILASIAISTTLRSSIVLQSEYDTLKAHLRYTQLRAIAQEYDYWGLRFRNNNWELYRNSMRTSSNLPGEENFRHSTPSGFTVRVDGANNRYVNFDDWGQPFINNNAPASSDILITLTYEGETRTLVVTPETGYLR